MFSINNMDYAISFDNVGKVIDEETILDGFNLKIKKGEIYGLLGVNGAGKTTLIKLMLQILYPTYGTIQILGKSVECENYNVLSKIGSIIETPVFYRQLSGIENLKIHCDYNNITYDNIDETMELVGLKNAKDKKVKNYSLGMRQRLGIGRAMIHNPELLILDEPINALDPRGILEIRNLLLELNSQKHTTIFISSHLISELQKISTKIGILHDGRLVDELNVKSLGDKMDMEEYFINLIGGVYE